MLHQQSNPRPGRLFASICQQGLAGGRPRIGLRPGLDDRDLGGYGTSVPFVRHLAARDQYGDDHPDLSDGLPVQNSQNRDSAAIQVKLDELIRTGALQNSFPGIEHLSADELEELRARCEERAKAVAAERRGAASTQIRGRR